MTDDTRLTPAEENLLYGLTEEAELLEASQFAVVFYATINDKESVTSLAGPFLDFIKATEYGDREIAEITAESKADNDRYEVRGLWQPGG